MTRGRWLSNGVRWMTLAVCVLTVGVSISPAQVRPPLPGGVNTQNLPPINDPLPTPNVNPPALNPAPARPAERSNLPLVIGLVAAAAFFVILIGGGTVAFLMTSRRAKKKSPPQKRRKSRDDDDDD